MRRERARNIARFFCPHSPNFRVMRILPAQAIKAASPGGWAGAAASENRAWKEGGSGLEREGVTIRARFFCAKAREPDLGGLELV